ncbi:hypothetical protein QJQ45_006112 [Haematococcus lacustris]|nr:hypothetical protein QJQ45_006112 [Haematococcus lacustris]
MCHGASTLSSIPMFGRVTLASDKKEDVECLKLLHARAPHIANAHMTLNVHLLKEYARECLGWKGKRLTQKKPLLRADILEHLRWEQEMEEDQLAEVGVDEADDMVDHAHYLRALEMQVDTGLSFNAIPKALKGSFAVMAPGQQLEVSIPCARSYGRASQDIALTVTEGQARKASNSPVYASSIAVLSITMEFASTDTRQAWFLAAAVEQQLAAKEQAF